MTPSGSAAPVSKLDRKHSDWSFYNEMWQRLELLSQGGEALRKEASLFITKRPKELYDVFAERNRIFTYQPILNVCIRWYVSRLFSRAPEVRGNTNDERFSRFLQDCDRHGATFKEFAWDLIKKELVFGKCYVLVDRPTPGETPIITRADEKNAGIDIPYICAFDPRSVFNWSVDGYGNLNWIVIKTLEIEQDDPLGNIQQAAHWYVFDRKTYRHYRYVSKQPQMDIARFFNESDPVAEGVSDRALATLVDGPKPHVLADQNRVPIRVCELPDDLWLTKSAYLHLIEHLNALNGYVWKLSMACHPQLVLYSDDDLKGQTLSETAYLQLAKGDKAEWLEPKGESFTESRMHIERTREEAYRAFHLQAQGRTSSATADGASAVSKEADMAPAIDVLNAIGDRIRAQQQLVLWDVKQAGKIFPDTMPDVNGYQFEIKPALQSITVAQALIDTGVTDKSPTLEKYVDSVIATVAMDGANEDLKKKAIDEIEKAPTRVEVRNTEEQAQIDTFQQRFQRQTATSILKQESEASAVA